MEKTEDFKPLIQLLPLMQRNIDLTDTHKNFGLTKSQIIILLATEYCGSITMGEAAKYISSSKEQATRVVNGLFEKDFVLRFEKKENRTQVHIRLTDKGERFVKEFYDALNKDLYAKLKKNLSKDDIDELFRSIKKVVTIMKKI